jgi:hypothetical protein
MRCVSSASTPRGPSWTSTDECHGGDTDHVDGVGLVDSDATDSNETGDDMGR